MNKRLKEFLYKKPVKIGLILIYGGVLAYVFFPHLIHNSQIGKVPKNQIVECPRVGKIIEIAMSDKGFEPKDSEMKACDQIKFTNNGTKYHQPVFGEHPIHLIYPGYNEKALESGEKNEILMSAFGQFEVHDHLHEEIEGKVIVVE